MPSKGEQLIEKLLKENHISYKKEFMFSDCKSLKGKILRFDFALFKGKQLVCLIEYDGEQHFEQVKHFQKKTTNFSYAAENDRRKNAYCLNKQIPLIRIPYWDYESLSLKKILTNPAYKVTNKFHNDILKREAALWRKL